MMQFVSQFCATENNLYFEQQSKKSTREGYFLVTLIDYISCP